MTGAVVWFTGLPASGKSTLARRVRSRLISRGTSVALLDSDELREVLEASAYGAPDRAQFYRSLAGLAGLLARQGLVVLVAATAASRAAREHARGVVGEATRFIEVWVRTSRAICEARDPKRLYARARLGELPELPGVGVAYEPPIAPEVYADGGLDEAATDRTVALVARLAAGAADDE
jgi:adenylylsulfate kinase